MAEVVGAGTALEAEVARAALDAALAADAHAVTVAVRLCRHPTGYHARVRRAFRITLLIIAIVASVCSASLAAGRWLDLLPEPVQWARFHPANPEKPPTLEEVEGYLDSSGSLRGRVRRAADGHHEVRYPRDDGVVVALAMIGLLAFTGFALFRRNRSAS
jgi:hypothetical protein